MTQITEVKCYYRPIGTHHFFLDAIFSIEPGATGLAAMASGWIEYAFSDAFMPIGAGTGPDVKPTTVEEIFISAQNERGSWQTILEMHHAWYEL